MTLSVKQTFCECSLIQPITSLQSSLHTVLMSQSKDYSLDLVKITYSDKVLNTYLWSFLYPD